MKSISKKWMQRMALTAMSLIVASAAQAITFDEALNLLPAKDLAALREAPASVVDALSDVSQVASAWKAGRMPMKDAELAAADAVGRLTASWDELASSPARARSVAHGVALVVLATDVKALMVASEWRTDGPLAEAMVGWLEGSESGLRPTTEDRPPDSRCFQNWQGCMQHCSNGRDFMSRSFCGLDCQLSFIGCSGGAIGEVVGGLIGSVMGAL